MTISFYFYSLVLGFVAGISLADVFNIGSQVLWLVFIFSVAISSFFLLLKRIKGRKIHFVFVGILIFCFAFVFGGFRMDGVKEKETDLPLHIYENQNVTVVGKVVEVSEGKLTLQTIGIVKDGLPTPIEPERLILNNVTGVFNFSDTVVVKGKLEKPKNFETGEGKSFDYISYLKKQNIYHVLSFGDVLEVKENDKVTLRTILYGIKEWFVKNVERVVSEPESSLATGVTVAGKGALPKDVEQDFVNAGLIHIVVLSGYNIAIVVRAMMGMFGYFGRRLGIVFALISIVLFVLMTGGTPPVVRAAIMAGITLLGTLSYKTVIQNRALFGAGLLMVLWNPYSLLYDASFALSMLATFAIINCVDPLKERMKFFTERFGVRQILSETLATQIVVLPYLLYAIGNLSLISPVSNIVILPLIPFIMLFTFLVGIFGFIPFVALPFGFILILFCMFVIGVADFLASIPLGHFEVESFPVWLMTLCYILMYILWIKFGGKKEMEEVTNTETPY